MSDRTHFYATSQSDEQERVNELVERLDNEYEALHAELDARGRYEPFPTAWPREALLGTVGAGEPSSPPPPQGLSAAVTARVSSPLPVRDCCTPSRRKQASP